MTADRFTLTPEFYQELLDRVEASRQEANRALRRCDASRLPGATKPPDRYPRDAVPGEAHLTPLIETTFWASLKREEGRALQFSVVYLDSEHKFADWAAKLKVPVPFKLPSVVRLAPAMGNRAAICVWPDVNGELAIWGRRIDSHASFSLIVLDPGQLVVKACGTNIAAVSGLEAVFIRNPQFSGLWNCFDRNGESTPPDLFRSTRVVAILEILRRMRQAGHGGAVVVIPDDKSWRPSIGSIAYEMETPYPHLQSAIAAVSDDDDPYQPPPEWDPGLQAAARDVARLTNVDGAVVLDRELGVVGYGAKFKPASQDLAESVQEVYPLECEDWRRTTPIDQLGGMRHQSAARFVFDNHDAVAFVVSQDGGVTAFAWEGISGEPAIHAFRKIELSLF